MADDICYNKCRAFLAASSKLDLYVSFRVRFGIFPYLTQCVDPKLRKAITKMRISAHMLPLETESNTESKTPRDERLCPFCFKVRRHYLIGCENEIFAKAKLPLRIPFVIKYPIFSGLDQKHKAQFLLECEEPQALNKVVKFCLLVHETFSDCFSITVNK